jgi:hypothetical protein
MKDKKRHGCYTGFLLADEVQQKLHLERRLSIDFHQCSEIWRFEVSFEMKIYRLTFWDLLHVPKGEGIRPNELVGVVRDLHLLPN